MPVKSKKGKRGKGKKAKKLKAKVQVAPKDPVQPEYIVTPEAPREKLINILKKKDVGQRDVYGHSIPVRLLSQLSVAEIKDLIDVFKIFDVDSDGYINYLEMRRGVKALGFKVTKNEARKLIHDVGFKKKGYIDAVEFLAVIVDKQGDSADVYAEILKGFEHFDYEKSGNISIDNLRQACLDTGIKFTTKELQDMIDEADTTGDGLVNQSEFINIMLQTNLF